MLTVPDKRLALTAYEAVLQRILTGEVAPGSLINERRLAEALGVSRTPIRDALLMLEGEGLLERQGGRGLQLRRMDVTRFIDNLAIRLLLEPEAARIAATRIDTAVLPPIATRLADLLADGAVDREEVRAVDDALHSAITEAADNPQMADIVRSLRRQTLMFDIKSVPQRREATCREHLGIIAALQARDGPGAAEAMRNHLEGVRASIIAHLSRR